jgi:hypothetical protein
MKAISLMCLLLITACTAPRTVLQPTTVSSNVLDSLLNAHTNFFGFLLKAPDSFRVQIIYTQINRDKNNNPHFTHYFYHVNNEQYFYPASTVKLPIALLSLEKLHAINIDKTIPFKINVDTTVMPSLQYSPDTATVEDCIKKIFLVSDNDAYNRLYEFLGQTYIHKQLQKKGYMNAAIRHRLEVYLTPQQNRYTHAVQFMNKNGTVIYNQKAQMAAELFPYQPVFLGNGYMQNDSLIAKPFDFSFKNKISLTSLHAMLQSIIFPTGVPRKQRFHLTQNDYRFLYYYMSASPLESTHPAYNANDYWDAYGKFLLFGADKKQHFSQIRIFNKIGDAYGFLTDVAYVVDFTNKVEFLLSATIYCNKDGIFNDEQYDYDSVGMPFMQHLGEIIYNYELKRNKTYLPDLTAYKIDYEK